MFLRLPLGCVLTCGLLVLADGRAACAEDFVLVRQSQPAATIVVAKEAGEVAAFAAAELRDHVARITGTTLPIVDDNTPVQGGRILVGESQATRALDLSGNDFKPREYLIALRPGVLVLMGAVQLPDRKGIPIPPVAVPQGLPPAFAEKGTLFAVYDFLERHCGVRWYAPGDVGIVCPASVDLVVKQEQDIRRAPAMSSLRLAGEPIRMPTAKDLLPVRDRDLWRLRMRCSDPYNSGGVMSSPFSHAFGGYFDRYLQDHPDWFAQGHPGRPTQPCFTRPGLIAQAAEDARNYFDGKGLKPGGRALDDFFCVGPEDTNQWCKCPDCQALMNPSEQNNPQFSNGKASDYIFHFTNQVARKLSRSHPDRWISQLAYSDYAYRPAHEELEPNIAVEMCLHVRNWWCPSMRQNDLKVLESWAIREKGKRPLGVWLYYLFPAHNGGKFNGFPGFFAHSVVRQMKLYHDAGVSGIYIEHSSQTGGNFLMDQLELYLTFKLADDPTLDGHQIIDEFFTRYYGPAAQPMKDFYTLVENTFMNPKSYPLDIQQSRQGAHQTEDLAWGSLGTAGRMASLEALMQQALAAAEDNDLAKQRTAMFDAGIWQPMRTGHDLYVAKRSELTQDHALKLADQWKIATDHDHLGVDQHWYAPEFDDSAWAAASILKTLEPQGYKDYLYAWYRTTAKVPADWSGQKSILYLGAVDESCWVWVNGQPAGQFEYNINLDPDSWNKPLRFDVTKQVKPGENNQITVLVRNIGGGGGLWKASYLLGRPANWQTPDWCKIIVSP